MFGRARQFMNAPKFNLCGMYEDGFPLMRRYLDQFLALQVRAHPTPQCPTAVPIALMQCP